MNDVLLVAPPGLDDSDRPSGGNVYDRRVASGLADVGWAVRVAEAGSAVELDRLLTGVPAGGVVLVDGLLGSAAPEVLLAAAGRVRLVVLVHLPLGVQTPGRRVAETRALEAAAAVVCTSRWTRDWLAATYGLQPDRLHVALPGTDPAPLGVARPAGERLLSVGALTPVKGHDVLIEALGCLADLAWSATCVGSGDVDADFASRLRVRAAGALGDRVRWAGALGVDRVEAAYADADVLVLPSRHETFGLVASEALARGLPVIASEVGGVAEALGAARDGVVPGLLVAPDDPAALAGALRSWLTDPDLRTRLRAAAGSRRATLPGWPRTCRAVAAALTVASRPRSFEAQGPSSVAEHRERSETGVETPLANRAPFR